jgi:hypothetical protein
MPANHGRALLWLSVILLIPGMVFRAVDGLSWLSRVFLAASLAAGLLPAVKSRGVDRILAIVSCVSATANLLFEI